jgi:hypothetical protein
LVFYFNSWELFDQVINMLSDTLSIFKEKEKFIYFFLMIFKFYVSENYYQNMGNLMQKIASFFEKTGELDQARLFYYNSVQWAVVQDKKSVK